MINSNQFIPIGFYFIEIYYIIVMKKSGVRIYVIKGLFDNVVKFSSSKVCADLDVETLVRSLRKVVERKLGHSISLIAFCLYISQFFFFFVSHFLHNFRTFDTRCDYLDVGIITFYTEFE